MHTIKSSRSAKLSSYCPEASSESMKAFRLRSPRRDATGRASGGGGAPNSSVGVAPNSSVGVAARSPPLGARARSKLLQQRQSRRFVCGGGGRPWRRLQQRDEAELQPLTRIERRRDAAAACDLR